MKKNKKKHGGGLTLLIVLAAVFLYGLVNARLVRLESQEYRLSGMDPRLYGTRILYVSDLKISNTYEAGISASLIKRLCAAEPDILIIGGDLTDTGCTEEALRLFFEKTLSITPRGGAYIVYGDSDILIPDQYFVVSPFTLLNGGQKKISLNGAEFVLAGYDGLKSPSRAFRFTDEGTGLCIVVSHDPSVSKLVPYITDSTGTPYCDLLLTGHTLGGQINIAGHAFMYSDANAEYPDESFTALTIPVLSSRGVGTTLLPLRYGTTASAYMITLK